MDWRKTKIIASLGPATDDEETLSELIDAGMDCARINCSHQSRQEILNRGKALRDMSIEKKIPVALLIDLQGPKVRLTENTLPRHLNTGEKVRIGSDTISVSLDNLSSHVSIGSNIVIGDGLPRLLVTQVEPFVEAEVISPGTISPRKGFVITDSKSSQGLTEKDILDLDTAVEIGADFIALSFVRDRKDIDDVRRHLSQRGSRARVIAKIEKLEAFENIDSIIDASDGILVARGDYGIEAGFSKVPLMQKQVIEKANRAGVLVITATQMLESMISSPMPTRAESSDVANAVLDGTSAVMLSAETAIGKYPVSAVRAMTEIIAVTEDHSDVYNTDLSTLDEGTSHDSVMSSATTLAGEIEADCIVVTTGSGKTARAAARHRSKHPIIALTPYQRVCDQLALEWGIRGAVFPEEESTRVISQKAKKIIREFVGDVDSFVLVRGDDKGPHTIRLVK